MTNQEFLNVVANRFNICKLILDIKEGEYGREDRLINFKRAAGLKQETPEQALLGIMVKQVVSLFEYGNDLNYPPSRAEASFDQWIEKINDVINYCVLLEGLLIERYINPEIKTPEIKTSQIIKTQTNCSIPIYKYGEEYDQNK